MSDEKTIKTYAEMLLDSLQKKNAVLDEIITLDEKQAELLKTEDLNMEEFDVAMEEKGVLIEKLNQLDDGFENLYDRVKEGLSEARNEYQDILSKIKKEVESIISKTASIQAQESRLKFNLDRHIKKKGKDLSSRKTADQAAHNYYQVVNKLNFVDSQFMDKKK